MTEDKVKAQIVDIVKKEYQMHMVNLFEGNVSARMEDRVWVTPSQVSKEEMTEDMLIEMDLSGHILKCPAGFRPSSETGMHLEVYRLCPDVQAVLLRVQRQLAPKQQVHAEHLGLAHLAHHAQLQRVAVENLPLIVHGHPCLSFEQIFEVLARWRAPSPDTR